MRCLSCGVIWRPEDIDIPGPCPECEHAKYEREQCAECPHRKLDAALESEVGALLHQAMDLDVSLDSGYTVTLADVTVEEWRAVQLLRSERARHERETESNAG